MEIAAKIIKLIDSLDISLEDKTNIALELGRALRKAAERG